MNEDYKNFRADRKYDEKLQAFTASILMIAIMFLLVVIGAVSEFEADVTDIPAFLALELNQCEETEYKTHDFVEAKNDQFF